MLPDNILFSSNAGQDIRAFIDNRQYKKIAVLVDENTRLACYPLIQPELPYHHFIEVPSGEENKNLTTCQLIWSAMTTHELDRHTLFIIIGGGVLGDMGGFCAATYKRGIDFILVPTTLLSQVDASVGGKLGIDYEHFKNHIGIFKHPALTVIDTRFLKTLNANEIRSGYAEIIKHALIRDAALWNQLKSQPIENQNWETLVKQNVAIKAEITESDPTEKGIRKLLNFGHTLGHAIESFFLQTNAKIMHGEAVAAGIITESWIAVKQGILSEESFKEIQVYILSQYGKLPITEDHVESISVLTLQDKKNVGNMILCVLLEKIGAAKIDCKISLDEVRQSLSYYVHL